MTDEELEALLNGVGDTGEGQRNLAAPGEEIGGPEEFEEGGQEIEGAQEIEGGGLTGEGGLTKRERLAAWRKELQEKYVNHKCFAVPFNSTNWEPGTVVNIIPTKSDPPRALLAIRLNDGRRLCKTLESKLVKVLPELDAPARQVRKYRRLNLTPEGDMVDPWTEEDIQEQVAALAENVGHLISFPETGQYGVRIEGGRSVVGRITRVIVNRQQRKLQYRVEVPDGDGIRVYTKTADTPYLNIAAAIDEEGELLQSKFMKKLIKKGALATKDVLRNYRMCEVTLAEADRRYKRAGEELEGARVAYERAKDAYIKAIENGLIEE